MTDSCDVPDSIDSWLAEFPTEDAIKEIARLRHEAALLFAQADSLVHLLEMARATTPPEPSA